MARTDKTDPSWVRLKRAGAREETDPRFFYKGRPMFEHIPADFKWSYAEQGVGPKEVRWAKRMRSKKNRRRDVPHRSMRGYGYGQENVRFT